MNSKLSPQSAGQTTWFCAVLLGALSISLVAAADLQPNFSKILDSIGEELVEDGSVPAMSIAVAKGPEIVFARGFGFADIENQTPAAADTIYRIGSVTKQFTAAAIMHLVEAGELRLDDTLTKFFPEYPAPGDQVTVQHLLQHTAGMKSFTGLASYVESVAEPVTHESLIARFVDEPFEFEPGEQFRYNNSAYYLLGVIIEKVSGKSYTDYLREHLFAVANLTDTGYGADEYPTAQHARGYMKKGRRFELDDAISMTQPFSAGALESTVEDLMRWQGALRSGRVVSPESYYLMTTPGRTNSGELFGYGFGLFAGTSGWRSVVQHGGGIHGFTCALHYFVDEDVTLAILTNSRNANPGRFVERIASEIFTEETGRKLDVLIRGGTIVDGTGAARREADLGIHHGEIVAVGDLSDAKAKTVIDAQGLIVAPGFVDVHNHSDTAIASDKWKLNEGFVRQGVTTIVGGPDGGLAPDGITRLLEKYADQGVATNVAFYVGHNAIRRQVMSGSQQRQPTDDEIAQMRDAVRDGMALGAVGLSTGLMYEPGMFSTTDEVVALAEEVAAFAGTYDSHVRNPVRDFLASHAEAAEIGRRAGIPSKLGHLKGVGLENEGIIRDVIAMVEDQRAQGHVVVSDQYPYDGAATARLRNIIIVPSSGREGASADLSTVLADPARREAIRIASENGIDGGFAWLKATGYSAMRIVSTTDYPDLVGAYLSELAAARDVEAFDLVCELILGADAPILITLGAIEEADVRALLVQPWNMIASDGSFTDAQGNSGQTHPRSTGTFPRVLGHYVRDEGLLTLEDAIRKMTWLPARHLGLTDRGRIAIGRPADLVVFDPETIAAKSNWDNPAAMPVGVQHVLVNGVVVLQDGELTGTTPGQFVRPHLGG
jgi:N-acyl-D-aspartate/D-glutamate deacylase/CubicO group peptidase (beta-lactamase class C family)